MITITQGGVEFPPRVTIERTAKGEIAYSVTVPHKSVKRARELAEREFLLLRRFAAEMQPVEGPHPVLSAASVSITQSKPAVRRRRGRPRKDHETQGAEGGRDGA